MPTENITCEWLNKKGKKLAPKTLLSQVQLPDGSKFEDKYNEDIEKNREDTLNNKNDILSINSREIFNVKNGVIKEFFIEISGELRNSVGVNLPAGQYRLIIDNVESDETAKNTSINFTNKNGTILFVKIPIGVRTNRIIALNENVDEIVFYASEGYGNSNGKKFKFSNVTIEKNTIYTDRLNEHDKSISEIKQNYVSKSQGVENKEKLLATDINGDVICIDKPAINQIESVDNSNAIILRKIISDYYFEEPKPPINLETNEYLDGVIKSAPEGNHFLFITDTHWGKALNPTGDGYAEFTNNAHNSPMLMAYVKEKLNIQYSVFGGDILNQDIDKYHATLSLRKHQNEFQSALGNNFFFTCGNHDYNTANIAKIEGKTENEIRLPFTVLYDACVKPYENIAHFENCTEILNKSGAVGTDLEELKAYCKLHFYIDDEKSKTRMIFINTGSRASGVALQYFGAKELDEIYLQFDWIHQSAISTPEEWNVILFGHCVIDSATKSVNNMGRKIAGILSILKTGRAYTVQNSSTNELLNIFYPKSKTYRIDSVKNHPIVMIMAGDKHYDATWVCGYNELDYYTQIARYNKDTPVPVVDSGIGNIPITTTLCDAYKVPEDDINNEIESMNLGTITEQAFDIVTLNKRKISFTRVGAGKNREIVFKN